MHACWLERGSNNFSPFLFRNVSCKELIKIVCRRNSDFICKKERMQMSTCYEHFGKWDCINRFVIFFYVFFCCLLRLCVPKFVCDIKAYKSDWRHFTKCSSPRGGGCRMGRANNEEVAAELATTLHSKVRHNKTIAKQRKKCMEIGFCHI